VKQYKEKESINGGIVQITLELQERFAQSAMKEFHMIHKGYQDTRLHTSALKADLLH
jgi:hypothetical protein